MTLPAEEFIRRFLIHVLPDGFQRIRYFGFLGNCHRAQKLQRCRELLGMAPAEPATEPPADYRDRFEALTGQSLRACPHCHTGIMAVVDRAAENLPADAGYVMTRYRLSDRHGAEPPARSGWKRLGSYDRERLRTQTGRPNPAYPAARSLGRNGEWIAVTRFLTGSINPNVPTAHQRQIRRHTTPIGRSGPAA